MDRVLCLFLCAITIVVSLGVLGYCNAFADEDHNGAEGNSVAKETNASYVPSGTKPVLPNVYDALIPGSATEETEVIVPAVTLYDVPLSEELQLHIIGLCEEHHIDPAIVIAMIFRESSFRPNVIGDSGDSYGLMQIQPKWHYERMQRLGCTDLLDPFQNVSVGVDILAEQIARYDGDVTKALVAYNRGHYSGTITQYAKNVLAYAEQIKNERGQ